MHTIPTHRRAIRTRYIGPSNVRGSRIQAKCEAKTVYVEYNDALNSDENHATAARTLCDVMGWNQPLVGGVFDGDYYWVEGQQA